MLTMPSDRFVKKCYLMMVNEDRIGRTNWASEIKELLFMNGFGYIWNNQGVRDVIAFIKAFEQRLKDIYIQDWHASIYTNPKLLYYKHNKTTYTPAKYLDILTVRK